MAANVPIAIIGAGIGGLTLARDLLRRGILSTIYEKSPHPSIKRRHNYGITLSADSCTSLSVDLSSIAPNFRPQVSVDSAQGQVHPASAGPRSIQAHQGAQLRAHRGKLESLLATDLDIRWGHELSSVEPRSNGKAGPATRLCFHNGHETTASLVVGADGVHSVLRSLLLPQVQPRVLPYVVFRGQRRVDAAGFGRCFAPALGEGNVVDLRQDGFVLLVAVDERDGNEDALISWFYSRRARPQNDILYRPDRKVNEASVIPEEFYEEISSIQGLEEPFRYICDMEMIRWDRIQNFLMRQLVVPDGNDFKELAKLGIVFLGDAAHATPIVGGEGADYAIQDALELADLLDDYDIGAFTKERASAEFHYLGHVKSDRLKGMILKFYETKFLGREGTSDWKSLRENAENALATMHNK